MTAPDGPPPTPAQQTARTEVRHLCLNCCSVGGRPSLQECEAAQRRLFEFAKRQLEVRRQLTEGAAPLQQHDYDEEK